MGIVINKNVPVFIISFNRLSYLVRLVEWLEIAGFKNINIVDNNSTYPPLLEYLQSSKYKVHRMDVNYGYLVVWKCGKFKEILDNNYYIVSDCDVLPAEECPLEVTHYFFKILKKYKRTTKAGFALKIDDLPGHFIFRDSVINWEKKFWINKKEDGLFDAPIDTTFALYRPGIYPSDKKWWKSIRTDSPYIARHLPWYVDSSILTEEDKYYQEQLTNRSTFWSITDVTLLQKYNNELVAELELAYSSRKWRWLQVFYKFCYLFMPKRFGERLGREKKLSTISDNIQILQKANKELLVKLSSIYTSRVWKLLQAVENLFRFKRKSS